MKITQELKNLSAGELHTRLAESRKELLKLSVQAATGNTNNPGKLRQNKKIIARIMTLLRQGEVKTK